MPTPFLPYQRDPIAGTLTTPNSWYEFFRSLRQFIIDSGLDTGSIDQILARLDELEQNSLGAFVIQGLVSVQVEGLPINGIVQVQLVNDEALPGNTYYYGTGPTGVKGWNTVRSALDFGDGIDLTTGSDGVTEISFNAATGEVAHLPGATYKTVQKTIDVMFSPGIITGGEVTQLTSTSVRITAGTAVVRVADDNVSELRFFDFASQDFSVPDVQVTHFYALDYNGGSPVIVETTGTEAWDRDTEIPLGSALRGDGLLNVTANPYRVGDVITNLIQRLDAVGPVQRDNSVGGLQLGEVGTRNVTVSPGRLWSRVSDFTVSAKNSSVDTMASLFFNGTNLTVTSGVTQWDNQNFNDLGTGTLVPIGNNKWANLWFFMSFDGTKYGFAYGTGEHNTLGDAANEGVPSYLTQNFFNQFILLGRFVFQESAATAAQIESAFDRLFTTQAVNTHNDLGGLQGGVTGEFYHLTAAQQADVAALSTGGTDGQFWRGDQVYSGTLNGQLTLTRTGNNGSLLVNGLTSGNGEITTGSTGGLLLRGTQAATAFIDIDPLPLDGASAANFRFFRATNTTGAAVMAVHLGDGSATTNHMIRGKGGNTNLCTNNGLLTVGTSTAAGPAKLQVLGGITPSTDNADTLGAAALRFAQTHTVNLHQSGASFESGVVSPAQLTANTDNWAIAGITSAGTVRASTDASRNLTGIASPTAGQRLWLVNVGSNDLVLIHDATSTAANRFLLPNSASVTLEPNDGVSLWYDNTSSRWRALSVTSAASAGSGALIKLGEVSVAAPTTDIDFAGLNLDADRLYRLDLYVVPNSTGAQSVSLFYNGDTVAANYQRQQAFFSAATSGPFRDNTAIISATGAITSTTQAYGFSANISKATGVRPSAYADGQTQDTSAIANITHAHVWTSTANVTSIKLRHSIANGFGVGTLARLYRLT